MNIFYVPYCVPFCAPYNDCCAIVDLIYEVDCFLYGFVLHLYGHGLCGCGLIDLINLDL